MRYCCKHVLDNCKQDMEFMCKFIDKEALERLQKVAETPFKRITYTEAVDILVDAIKTKKKTFEKKNRDVGTAFVVDFGCESPKFPAHENTKKDAIILSMHAELGSGAKSDIFCYVSKLCRINQAVYCQPRNLNFCIGSQRIS